jgi:protein gp37
MARRFGRTEAERAFLPTFHPERLGEPARLRKPSKIFVCSTADLMGDGVDSEQIRAVARSMREAPQHTYQVLTKRPLRYRHDCGLPPGAWRGATATDHMSWDHACAALRPLPGIRWISAEPLLGRIELGDWVPDWVVVGLLTPRFELRTVPLAWELIINLRARGVPVFTKGSVPDVCYREWPEVRG